MTVVAVLGGGISGLSSAYYLSRLAPASTRIVLVEGSQRLGGWIRSARVAPDNQETNDPNGILFEGGPRSLRPVGTSGAVTLEMIKHLGLDEGMISVPKTDPSAKNRYIYYNDTINTLPSSLSSLLTKRPPVLKSVPWSILKEPFVPAKSTDDDESLYSIVSRRFNDHVALNLVGAMVHGIYAGDVKNLSAHSTLKLLHENERVYGSIVKGMLKGGAKMERFRERGLAARARKDDPEWFASMEGMSVIGFKDGTEALTHRLRQWLARQDNVDIVLGEPVESVSTGASGKEIKIKTSARTIEANHVISALPSGALDAVLPRNTLPHLTYNPSVDVAVVNLAYGPDVPLGYDGFGFLTPSSHSTCKIPVPGTLGVVFDSNAMRGQDTHPFTKATVMLGGHQWNTAFKTPLDQTDPQEAYQRAIQAMDAFLGVKAPPVASMVHMQAKCIPQYLVGHPSRLRDLHEALKLKYGHLMSVTGASYWSVSVPDCVKNSRELVEELLVSGALGGQHKVVTGLNRLEESGDKQRLQDSSRLGKSHVDILMKS